MTHPINQKVAAKMLEKMGYRVDVAANGVEALDALQRVAYALVLWIVRCRRWTGLKPPP